MVALCEGIVAKGWPIQANRVQALISKIFSFALDSELVSANPCARLKKRSKEVRVTRVLSDQEIRLFWRRIGESPNSVRMGQALRLVLLTGVRVTELAGAEIREFDRLDDFAAVMWTVPAARSKNGRAHVISLSALALDIVTDLLKQANLRAGEKVKPRYILASPSIQRNQSTDTRCRLLMSRFGNALNAE